MERPLGRGLDSLIARTLQTEATTTNEIRLDLILPNPRQPRKVMDDGALEGLAASIQNHGVLQPIVVRGVEGGYELIAGERRFRASKMAGKVTIPAVVVDAQGIRSLELALIENIQRENLSALEEAAAFEQLIVNTGLTHQELAARMGKSRAAISNSMRLLELPDDVKNLMASGSLSAGQARAILGAPTHEEARELAKAAVSGGWTVRQVEQEVRSRRRKPRKGRASNSSKPGSLKNKAHYQDELRVLYGTRVQIIEAADGGEIRFRFYSDDDRDRLLNALLKVRSTDASLEN